MLSAEALPSLNLQFFAGATAPQLLAGLLAKARRGGGLAAAGLLGAPQLLLLTPPLLLLPPRRLTPPCTPCPAPAAAAGIAR